MESSTKKKRQFCCKYHLFGVTFIAFGIALIIFLPDVIHHQIMTNLQLKENTVVYSEWKKPSKPFFMNIYIFNWTNPQDIRNRTIKPVFKQLGPYRFQEIRDKQNITFLNNQTTVIYRKLSTYFFDAEGSDGTLDDIISLPNAIAISAGAKVKDSNAFAQFGLGSALKLYKEELHVVRKVRDLLFEGYEDGLIKFGSVFSLEKTVYDKGGYFYKRNATDELSGDYEIYTGIDDISKIGEIKTFNNLTEFPYHKDECKKLRGSPGEFFPPARTPEDQLHLFTPEMCRSLVYDYEKDVEFKGMKGHRYALGERTIDNGTLYEENICYDKFHDLPSGVIDISVCNYGSPSFTSYPHFYKADSSYIEVIAGLEPNKELHESFTTLEPVTGVTLEAMARIQSNMLLRPYGLTSLFKGVPSVMLPVFYTEHHFVLDDENASKLRIGLLIYKFNRYLGIILIVFGILLIFSRSLWKLFSRSNKSDSVKQIKEINPLL